MPRSKGDEPKVMSASNQTDEERRILRTRQRSLQKEILQRDDIENPNSTAFQEVRERNNELFAEVRYTREGVLDGENLDLISSRAARQVDKLTQVPRYDTSKLIAKLREKCGTDARGRFNLLALGREVGMCFNSVPTGCTTFNGPLEAEYHAKARKPRARKSTLEEDEEEDVEEEKPETVKQRENKGDVDKLSNVEKHIKVINKTLNKRCREEGQAKLAELNALDESELTDEQRNKKRNLETQGCEDEICAIQYLFNPHSFTQTVENMFHFSFLVRNGTAGIRVDDETKLPLVRRTDDPKRGEGGAAPPKRQAVIALNMKEWKDLCEAFEVQESDVPHRVGSKFESGAGRKKKKSSSKAD